MMGSVCYWQRRGLYESIFIMEDIETKEKFMVTIESPHIDLAKKEASRKHKNAKMRKVLSHSLINRSKNEKDKI